MDAVMRTLEEIGNLMGRQAQERAATIAQAAEAAATPAVANNGNQGQGDPEIASLWMEALEKAFEVFGCTDEEKVTLAVYQLQGNASDWWKATRGRVFPAGVVQTWAMFVEYEAEFSRLSKFAPRMMEDPWDKARSFRDGLKPDIRSQMVSLNLGDYNEIYERVQAIERDLADRAAASGSRYAPVRDNRNFGKRSMSGNQRFIPSVKRTIEWAIT
ncbi:uncharacterized protein LOC130136736 [Syzygium oleosum]|uniref:uncharacterized protein LOC130136736 n=1 Tax=Syzygium oleosum TaxID=219896 RepID=UPI0024BA1130|nr:uncharacterized protein LOC130136736 [Syzygium oleosum]